MTANMRVDAFASQPHYFDHLQPIAEALGIPIHITPHMDRDGIEARSLKPSDVPTLVAGYPDMRRIPRPIIFVEHGVGENYGLADPHYSGGAHREKVELFLCPNERVAEANRIYEAPSVVVGSPRLEWLYRRAKAAGGSRDGRLRVAVSFHWNCRVHPQAGTALFDFQLHFKSWAQSDLEIRGHAHPRIAARARKMFALAGIEFIEDFSDVISWADVYAVDNSSTLFEAAALGLDVVVMDSPHYTSEETGFRFWKYADIGPRISAKDSLVEAAIHAKAQSSSYSEIRHRMVAEIFGPLEGATQRAIEAINQWYNGHLTSPRSLPRPDPISYPR